MARNAKTPLRIEPKKRTGEDERMKIEVESGFKEGLIDLETRDWTQVGSSLGKAPCGVPSRDDWPARTNAPVFNRSGQPVSRSF